MVTLTISGENVRCPVSKVEITTGKYQHIIDNWSIKYDVAGLIQLFSLLTGMSEDKIAEATEDDVEALLFRSVLFFEKENLDKEEMPSVIKVGERILSINTGVNFNRFTLAQKLMAKQILARDYRISIARLVAIYLEPQYSGLKWDEESDIRVEELTKLIEQLPITQVYPVGSFFMKGLAKSGKKLAWHLPLTQRITQVYYYVSGWRRKVKSIFLMSSVKVVTQ